MWYTVGNHILVQSFPFMGHQQSSACPQDYLSLLPTTDIGLPSPWAGCCEGQTSRCINWGLCPPGWHHQGGVRAAWLDQNPAPLSSRPVLFSLHHQNQCNVTMLSAMFLRELFSELLANNQVSHSKNHVMGHMLTGTHDNSSALYTLVSVLRSKEATFCKH